MAVEPKSIEQGVRKPSRMAWMGREGCGATGCWHGRVLWEKAEMPPNSRMARGEEPIGAVYIYRYWGTCPECNGNWKHQ